MLTSMFDIFQFNEKAIAAKLKKNKIDFNDINNEVQNENTEIIDTDTDID